MPALKSDNIHLRYQDFSDLFDLAFKSRSIGWTAEDAAKRLGIQIVRDGHYMERGEDYAFNRSPSPRKGLADPSMGRYEHENLNEGEFKSRAKPKQRNYYPEGPDIPYPEEYQPRVKPRTKPGI